MAIPTQREELVAAGYVFDNEARCRGCEALIEWWITPNGKKMPMSVKAIRERDSPIAPVKEWQRIPHWSDCPNAKDFKR
jgi:hypothetical protein